MEAFPFIREEWDAVGEAALPMVNATFAGDDALQASLLVDFLELMADLKSRHGDHPVLLETEADFIRDDQERAELYQRAEQIAESNGLPTLSIRLSFAKLLMDTGRPKVAEKALLDCESELTDADKYDKDHWNELMEEARQAMSKPASPSDIN